MRRPSEGASRVVKTRKPLSVKLKRQLLKPREPLALLKRLLVRKSKLRQLQHKTLTFKAKRSLNVAPVVHREARTRRHLLWKPPLLQGWWNNRRSANRAGRRVARTRKPSNGRLVKLELQKAGEAPDVPKEARTNPRRLPLNHRVKRLRPKRFGSQKIGVFATRVTFLWKFTE